MSRKFIKEMQKRFKELDEDKNTYPDYSDISILFAMEGKDIMYSVPNKTKSGKITTYSMLVKKELITEGVCEDYLEKVADNYFIMQRNENMKYKLFKIKSRKKIQFNLKSNINHKEYSDGFTIIDDLRKERKFISMYKIINSMDDYYTSVYFDSKRIIKLRALIASGKIKSVYKEDHKYGKYGKIIYVERKDLSKIKRFKLCMYYSKKEV